MSRTEVGVCCTTATSPCGVTVSAIAFRTYSVTYSTSIDASAAFARMSGCFSQPFGVANSSTIASGR
jgi:hypothetical protein